MIEGQYITRIKNADRILLGLRGWQPSQLEIAASSGRERGNIRRCQGADCAVSGYLGARATSNYRKAQSLATPI
jgi:hypothetical protein